MATLRVNGLELKGTKPMTLTILGCGKTGNAMNAQVVSD